MSFIVGAIMIILLLLFFSPIIAIVVGTIAGIRENRRRAKFYSEINKR